MAAPIPEPIELLALGEPMVEFNQTGEGGGRLYLQGFGGDTSNFAISAARQGARAGYISALGDDSHGRMLREGSCVLIDDRSLIAARCGDVGSRSLGGQQVVHRERADQARLPVAAREQAQQLFLLREGGARYPLLEWL